MCNRARSACQVNLYEPLRTIKNTHIRKNYLVLIKVFEVCVIARAKRVPGEPLRTFTNLYEPLRTIKNIHIPKNYLVLIKVFEVCVIARAKRVPGEPLRTFTNHQEHTHSKELSCFDKSF